MALDTREQTPRCQANRRVSNHFFAIRISDIRRLILFDLMYGYTFFGRSLFIVLLKGITQGSPLSPGIADCVLRVLEEKNKRIFLDDGNRWANFVLRWVDDIWFSVVHFVDTASVSDPLWITDVFPMLANCHLDSVEKVYLQSEFGLKLEDVATFVGMGFDGLHDQWHVCQSIPLNPDCDRRFRNAFSFCPDQQKVGMIIGQLIGFIDRMSHSTCVGQIRRLGVCFESAGYSRSMTDQAVAAVLVENPFLKDFLRHVNR